MLKVNKLFMVFFFAILLVGTVSAFEFDNVKEYNPITKEVTIKNCDIWLGVCLNEGEVLGTVKLLSELDEKVEVGYVKVWEKEYDTTEDTLNAIGEERYYNIREGMKPIEIELNYKYKVVTPEINKKCQTDNKTQVKTCEDVVHNIITWEDYDSKDLPKGKITLSGWTTTEKGDSIEHVPTYFGKAVEEWATWTADDDVNLIAYYNFDSDITDSYGDFDGTNNGADAITGKVGGAYNVDGVSEWINLTNWGTFGSASSGVWTMNFWYNSNTTASGKILMVKKTTGSGQQIEIMANTAKGGGADTNKLAGRMIDVDGQQLRYGTTNDIATLNDGKWHMITFVTDGVGGTASIYFDNASQAISYETQTNPDNYEDFVVGFPIGARNIDDSIDEYATFDIDEFGVWTGAKDVNFISRRWNSGAGDTWEDTSNKAPSIILNSPANNTGQTTNLVTINIDATDNKQIDNVTLYIDGVLNETNSSNVNGTYIFTKYLTEGNHNWSILAYDNESASNQSETRTILIDTISPVVSITAPIEAQLIQNQSALINVTFNYSASDANIGSCWYNGTFHNGTAQTIADTIVDCALTTTYIGDLNASNTLYKLYFCANDTAGTETCTSARTFVLNEITETFTYNASVIEESTTQINLTIGTTNNFTTLIGNLTYNGTLYPMSLSSQTLYASVTTPSVILSENATFNFTYIINGETVTTGVYNQTIINFTGIEVSTTGCSAGLEEVLNFTFKKENNQTIQNTTGAYIFRYGLESNSSFRTTNGNYTDATQLFLCVNTTISNEFYVGYGEIQYQASGFTERRYYVFEGTRVTNVSTAIDVFSLNNAESTSFLMSIQDSGLNPYVGYYLGLTKWYPDLDSYQTVELGKTDDEGQTVLKVETEDVDYRLGVYYANGSLVHLTSPFRLVCLVSPCSYTITVPTTGADLYERWENLEVSLTYNTTTGVVTYIYNDPSQTTSNMTLNVYKVTGTSDVLICTDTAIGYTGVMSCNVSTYTGLIKAEGGRTASPFTTAISNFWNVAQEALDDGMAMFITLAITALLIFVGIASPVLGIILTIVGLIPAVVFGFLPFTIVMSTLCLGFMVIWFMKKT